MTCSIFSSYCCASSVMFLNRQTDRTDITDTRERRQAWSTMLERGQPGGGGGGGGGGTNESHRKFINTFWSSDKFNWNRYRYTDEWRGSKTISFSAAEMIFREPCHDQTGPLTSNSLSSHRFGEIIQGWTLGLDPHAHSINMCKKVVYVLCARTVPVVDAGLGLPVPQTYLHSSRNVDGQPSLKLCTRPQTRLQLDDLREDEQLSLAYIYLFSSLKWIPRKTPKLWICSICKA